MRIILLGFLLGAGVSVASRTVIKEFHLVKKQKAWHHARNYCRKNFSDLVSIDNISQNNQVQKVSQGSGTIAWIGIHDRLKDWRWSLRKQPFRSDKNFNRLRYVALRTSHSLGASITVNGTWIPKIMSQKLPSVCYNADGPAKYILVEDALTWSNARNICKSKYTDLVTVNNSSENDLVSRLVSSDSWIGLNKDSWVWSSRARSTFTNWDLDIPFIDDIHIKCILVNFTTGKWFEGKCGNHYPFVCQHVFHKPLPKTYKTTMTFKFQSEIDLKDATIKDQVLEQLRAKLQKHKLPHMKLHWVQTEKQPIDESPQKKKTDQGPGD